MESITLLIHFDDPRRPLALLRLALFLVNLILGFYDLEDVNAYITMISLIKLPFFLRGLDFIEVSGTPLE